MPGTQEFKAAAVASDIKYIRCKTCELMMKHASRTVKGMREKLKPGQKLSEGDIIEELERMCNPTVYEGTWMTHYDMVENGDKIDIVDKGQASKCNSECATIARACSQISDDLDLSDLSEALFAGKSRSALVQLACYEQSNACSARTPPLPKDRKPGPEHIAMSAEEEQQKKLMDSMKAAGMSGQMFNKDDIKAQLDSLQEQADDGEFPTRAFHEEDDSTDSTSSGQQGSVVDTVIKAAKVVQDKVGTAWDLFKSSLNKLAKPAAAEKTEDAEL
eukprot:gene5009-5250_t